MARHTREFPSDLAQVAAMRAFIAGECRRAWSGHVEHALDQLLLAVHEAATNIIRHGYQDDAGRLIRLVLEIDPDRAQVVFSYPGRHFDPDRVPYPVFDGTREGGFGVYLIRQLVDEVHYTRDGASQCGIQLVKKRQPATPQEHSHAIDG